MKVDEIILMDSADAASIQTVTGWVSRDGFYYGKNERAARYAGCTHRRCEECETVIKKNWLKCPECRRRRAQESFAQMEIVEWDGATPIALYDSDEYFFDHDQLLEYAEEAEIPVDHLQLVLCVPHHPGSIELNDWFSDYLPEDGEVDDPKVLSAVDALNSALKSARPFSWMPSDKRVIVKPETNHDPR